MLPMLLERSAPLLLSIVLAGPRGPTPPAAPVVALKDDEDAGGRQAEDEEEEEEEARVLREPTMMSLCLARDKSTQIRRSSVRSAPRACSLLERTRDTRRQALSLPWYLSMVCTSNCAHTMAHHRGEEQCVDSNDGVQGRDRGGEWCEADMERRRDVRTDLVEEPRSDTGRQNAELALDEGELRPIGRHDSHVTAAHSLRKQGPHAAHHHLGLTFVRDGAAGARPLAGCTCSVSDARDAGSACGLGRIGA